MSGAGLSPHLRDSTCFFQADGQKSPGRDPALREKRDPEVAERYIEVANTLRRNRKALLFAFLLDPTVPRARPESSASIETPLRPPAMFQLSVSLSWIAFRWRSISTSNASGVLRGRFTREKNYFDGIAASAESVETSRILREFVIVRTLSFAFLRRWS